MKKVVIFMSSLERRDDKNKVTTVKKLVWNQFFHQENR